MGKRGPQPTPTAIKLARGTYRADRAAGNEAKPIGKPKPPAWLKVSKDALREFARLAKELHQMGLVGSVDANALARYSVTWVRWRIAVEDVLQTGDMVVYKNEDGSTRHAQCNPNVALARTLGQELSRLEASFGMNPSARSRVEIAPPKFADHEAFFEAPKSDPNEEFFDTPPLKMTS